MKSWGQFYQSVASTMALYHQTNERLVQVAGLRPGMTVVDLGGGSGLTAAAALRAVPEGLRLHLVDSSSSMVAAARTQLGDRVVYHTASAEQFADGIPEKVDRVLCNMAFWYFRDPEAVLAQIRQVLKPTGFVCFNLSGTFFNTGGGVVSPQWALLHTLAERGESGVRPVPSPERLPNQRSIEGTLHGARFKPIRYEVQEIETNAPDTGPGGELYNLIRLYPIAQGATREEAAEASVALMSAVQEQVNAYRPRWRVPIFIAQPTLSPEEMLMTKFGGRLPTKG